MKTFQSLIIKISNMASIETTEVAAATLSDVREAFNAEINKYHPTKLDFQLKFRFDLLCANNTLGTTESIKSTAFFLGEAATYKMVEFREAMLHELKCCYVLPNEVVPIPVVKATIHKETTTSDQPPFGVALGDTRSEEEHVDAGRQGIPLRGITKRKRPTYMTLWKILTDSKQKRSKFIRMCTGNYNISNTTALKWYAMLQAVSYRKIPCYAKWPGNEVMLKHYHNKTTRPVICDLYDVSMSTFTVWQALIKEVLLKDPNATVASTY